MQAINYIEVPSNLSFDKWVEYYLENNGKLDSFLDINYLIVNTNQKFIVDIESSKIKQVKLKTDILWRNDSFIDLIHLIIPSAINNLYGIAIAL
jgi:hypothetical protein